MLQEMVERRVEAAVKDGEELFDAQLNARLVANAEQYYRIMYYGSDESWNHRDTHMFETLKLLLERYGPSSKGGRLGTQLALGERQRRRSSAATARSTSGNCAARSLATTSTRSAKGRITGRSRPPRIGMGRWRSRESVRRIPTATSV